MPLTSSQKTTLKTYILAQVDLAPYVASGQDNQIRIAMNADASPVVLAWRKSVSPDESDEAPAYANFDTIPAGKRDSWGFFLRTNRNFSKNKIRAWVVDVWGTVTAGSDSEKILLAGTENASRAEVVLGGTTKVTGTVSGLDRTFVGDLTDADIASILRG